MKRVFSSGSKLPIIFISADKHQNIADRVLKEGAVGFLQKTFDGQTLVDLINVASECKTWNIQRSESPSHRTLLR